MPVDLTGTVLEKMYNVYQRVLRQHLKANHLFWGRHGAGGTVTNIEQTLFSRASGQVDEDGRPASMQNGCQVLQDKTYWVCRRCDVVGYRVARVVIGRLLEHHAVSVHPFMDTPELGYIFDPWLKQEPLVFSYAEWVKSFKIHAGIKSFRTDWG